MLRKICLVFLFVFVFAAGTIVGSHFKSQVDQQKSNVADIAKDTLKSVAEKSYDDSKTEDDDAKETSSDLEETYSKIKKTVKKATRNRKLPQKSKKKQTAKKLAGKYTVQIASFPSQVLAKKMASELREQDHDAIVFTGTIKGKTWHRVGIGSFQTIGEANKKQRQLVLDKVARGSIISKIK